MALQGTLDTFALPDVLRLLAATRKTGRLRITGDRGTGSAWVDAGAVQAVEAPHAPHHHPDEEIVLVKEGTLSVMMKGTTTTAGPGSIILAASNDEHGWRNTGATTATYYVMRIVTDATPKTDSK